jgi:4-amino-4-deoxy-L-arabinose transferase-like glycosyltransferase
MTRRHVWGAVFLSATCLLAIGGGLWTDAPAGRAFVYLVRLAGSLLLVGFVPGWVLLNVIPISSAANWLTKILAAMAISYAIAVVALLALVYLAGAITPAGVLLTLGVLLACMAGLAWRGRLSADDEAAAAGLFAPPSPWTLKGLGGRASSAFTLGLCLLVVMAALLRMWGNQYSDLQGDEAEILIRAGRLILGTDNSLVTHSKGPAEILIVSLIAALTGRMDEFTVRLPFALASVGGVAGVMLIGRRWFGPAVGLVAGGLLAVNGVFVTYARTAQYQSLMFLFSVWAAWFAFDYYERGKARSLLLAAFLYSAAFLTHFEAILLLPLPVFLVWRRLAFPTGTQAGKRTTWSRQWPALAGSVTLMGVILAAFYVPAFLNPQLRETGSYLAQRVGSALPTNNFPLLYISSLTYNASYYLVLSAGLLGIGLLAAFRRVWRWGGLLWAMAALLAGGLAVALGRFWPSLQPAYLLLLSALGAIGLIFAPGLPDRVRAVVVWATPAWLVYLFLVVRPGNHYYVFFPAAALLAGWGVEQVAVYLPGSSKLPGRLGTKGVVVFILVTGFSLCAYYEYILVVRNDLEYILTYPDNRRSLFVTDARFPFGTRIGFGFPYRLGWQMVGHLYRVGELRGDWGGNDKGNSPDWYTWGAARTDCYPRNVMLGEITYKEDYEALPFDLQGSGYSLRYRIWDNQRLRMQVYTFDPLGEFDPVQDLVEPAWYPTQVTTESLAGGYPTSNGESLAAALLPFQGPFGMGRAEPLSPPVQFSLSGAAKQQLADVFDPRLTQVNDWVELVGYELDDTWSQPGGALVVTLYWRAIDSVHLPFKVFVHLSGDQVVAQGDGFPACGTAQMPYWRVGELVADRHVVYLPPDTVPGDYGLEIGIYEPQTGLRMDKLDGAGNPAGNSLHLVDVGLR